MNSPWYLKRLGLKDHPPIRLSFGETLLGRLEESKINIPSVFASRRQCMIRVNKKKPDEIFLKDLNSSNGTFVNTTELHKTEIKLHENDDIGIGCCTDSFDDDNYFVFRLIKLKKQVKQDSNSNNVTIKHEIVASFNLISSDEDESSVELETKLEMKYSPHVSEDETPKNQTIKVNLLSQIHPDQSDDEVICISDDESEQFNEPKVDVLEILKMEESVEGAVEKAVEEAVEGTVDDEDCDVEEDSKVAAWLTKLSQNIDQNIVKREIEIDESSFVEDDNDIFNDIMYIGDEEEEMDNEIVHKEELIDDDNDKNEIFTQQISDDEDDNMMENSFYNDRMLYNDITAKVKELPISKTLHSSLPQDTRSLEPDNNMLVENLTADIDVEKSLYDLFEGTTINDIKPINNVQPSLSELQEDTGDIVKILIDEKKLEKSNVDINLKEKVISKADVTNAINKTESSLLEISRKIELLNEEKAKLLKIKESDDAHMKLEKTKPLTIVLEKVDVKKLNKTKISKNKRKRRILHLSSSSEDDDGFLRSSSPKQSKSNDLQLKKEMDEKELHSQNQKLKDVPNLFDKPTVSPEPSCFPLPDLVGLPEPVAESSLVNLKVQDSLKSKSISSTSITSHNKSAGRSSKLIEAPDMLPRRRGQPSKTKLTNNKTDKVWLKMQDYLKDIKKTQSLNSEQNSKSIFILRRSERIRNQIATTYSEIKPSRDDYEFPKNKNKISARDLSSCPDFSKNSSIKKKTILSKQQPTHESSKCSTKSSTDLQQKRNRIAAIDRFDRQQRSLKDKWKTGIKKSASIKSDQMIKDRKSKLQELGIASWIKPKKNDEPKALILPKVKITDKNRGAFLTESIPKPILGRRKSVSVISSMANGYETDNYNDNKRPTKRGRSSSSAQEKIETVKTSNENIVKPVEEIADEISSEILRIPSTSCTKLSFSPMGIKTRRRSHMPTPDDYLYSNDNKVTTPCKISSRRRSTLKNNENEQNKDETTLNKPSRVSMRRRSIITNDDDYGYNSHETAVTNLPVNRTQSNSTTFNKLGTYTKSVSTLPRIPKLIKNGNKNENQLLIMQTPSKPNSKIESLVSKNDKPPITGSILKSFTSGKSANKSVRFKDGHEIHYFEFENENPNRPLSNVTESVRKEKTLACQEKIKKIEKEIVVNTIINKREMEANYLNVTEDIINNITQWHPNWLKMDESQIPNLNGTNSILLPMVHIFRTCEDYQKIVIPLLKIEMWYTLREDYDKSKSFVTTAAIKTIDKLKKGDSFRYVFSCEVIKACVPKSQEPSLCNGSVVLVNSGKVNFFAYITNQRSIKVRDKFLTMLTLESSATFETGVLHNEMRINITSLSYIRVFLASMALMYCLKYSKLCNIILNPQCKIPPPMNSKGSLDGYMGDENLNDTQKQILMYTFDQCKNQDKDPNIILIDGPPGTGKSCLISNLIAQLVLHPATKKLKLLICSSSNTAIDIIMNKLIQKKTEKNKDLCDSKIVRFGILEKMSSKVKPFSLQKLCEKNTTVFKRNYFKKLDTHDGDVLQTMVNEKEFLEKKILFLEKHSNKSTIEMDELRELKGKLVNINKIVAGRTVPKEQIEQFEKSTYSTLVLKAEVICTTLTSCVHLRKYLHSTDICIIDEATQCTEPWTLTPLQFGISTLVLVGDTQQLPATVRAKHARDNGLNNSLFTRIQKCYADNTNPMISMNIQYRMHSEICCFPNKYFYSGKLISEYKNDDVNFPLKPYSVVSLDYSQNNSFNEHSVKNLLEAELVASIVSEIYNLTLYRPYSIGVIAPYTSQKEEIFQCLTKHSIRNVTNIDVNTIDSYQGQERDIIIISTTRTNGIGFLENPQRLNVALTRAKHCLIICGNFISIQSIPVWQKLIENANERKLIYKYNSTTNHNFTPVLNFIKK